jgi:hypothetical protein
MTGGRALLFIKKKGPADTEAFSRMNSDATVCVGATRKKHISLRTQHLSSPITKFSIDTRKGVSKSKEPWFVRGVT